MVAPASASLASVRVALTLIGCLPLGACEAWHLSINSDGLVFVSIIGDAEPHDRFRLRTSDGGGAVRTFAMPKAGPLEFSPVSGGALELTLLPPDGCQVSGLNPRSFIVASGQELRLAFDVTCK